jgi:hypothetical protein
VWVTRRRGKEAGQVKRATPVVLLFVVVLAVVASALAAGPKGTRGNPYRVHTFVRLPEARGWKLRVNKTIPNATRAVVRWNKFNAPPRAGDQYFVINISLGYAGDRANTFFPGSPRRANTPFPPTRLSAVGRSNITYTSISDACGSVPGALNFGWRVRRGESVSGNICFSVGKTDVRGLLLKYEDGNSLHPKAAFFKLR